MEYYIIENKEHQGPFSIDQLREMGITADRLVWSEDMEDWTPASEVEELNSILRPSPLTPPEIPGKKKDSCLKRFFVAFLFLLVALLIAMAVSNPGKDAHKRAIANNVLSGIQKSADAHDDLFGTGLQIVQKMLSSRVFDTMLDGMLDYESYLFFSKGSVTFDGKPHTVSYGVFGKIFTLNEDDVATYIEQNNPFASLKDLNSVGKDIIGEAQTIEEAIDNIDTKGLLDNLGDELVGTMGQLVKKQMTERTDSATGDALERIIDGVTDIIKNGIREE